VAPVADECGSTTLPTKPSRTERVAEALGTGACTLAVSCPFLFDHDDDGINARTGDMTVRDIAEILADALRRNPRKLARLNQPMEFDLTPEQLSLQKAAIDFARAELSSDMIERDAKRAFSHDGWKKCAAFGRAWFADSRKNSVAAALIPSRPLP